MHQRTIFFPRIDRSMIPGLLLLGLWFAGVSLGLWAERFYGESVRVLALSAGREDLYYWNSCVATVLPLFLSAFAVCFFHRAGAYWVCLLRGFLLGFVLGCLTGVGGLWLGLLLQFSAVAESPVILWFLWRRLSLGTDGYRWDLVCAFLAAFGISAVDFWVVAPFLGHALSF